MSQISKNYGFEHRSINRSATFVSLLVLFAFLYILSPAVYAVDYPGSSQLNLTNQTSTSDISSSFKKNLDLVYDEWHEYADKFSASTFTKDGTNYAKGTFISNITTPLNLTNNFSVSQAFAPQKRKICIFMSNAKDGENEVTYGRVPLQGFVSNFFGFRFYFGYRNKY